MFYWNSAANQLHGKIAKQNNGKTTYSCFKGALGVIGKVVGIIPGYDCKCPKCIIEQTLPVDYSYSTNMMAATQVATAQGVTDIIAAIGNMFAAKKVKLDLLEMFKGDPSKI